MSVTMRQMLEAGVHFGHQTRYWNPKMESFIFGERNKIHIINLEKTFLFLKKPQNFLKILQPKRKDFICWYETSSKRNCKEEAERSGCPFVNHRWLGGMLTNFKTVKQSIKRLNELETMIADGSIDKLKKREGLTLKRDHEKLVRSIGGIKEMTSLPDAIFIIDVGFEAAQ